MKLSSKSVLDITRKMLGLDDVHPKVLEKCLDFHLGRVLLVGNWSPGTPQFLYAAARRTVEGGRNLRAEHWAIAIDRRKSEARPKRKKPAKRATKSTKTRKRQTTSKRTKK